MYNAALSFLRLSKAIYMQCSLVSYTYFSKPPIAHVEKYVCFVRLDTILVYIHTCAFIIFTVIVSAIKEL